MATLKHCKTCNQEVSSSAKMCPHCGQDNPTRTYKNLIISSLVFCIIIGVGIKLIASNKQIKSIENKVVTTSTKLTGNNTANEIKLTFNSFINNYNNNIQSEKNSQELIITSSQIAETNNNNQNQYAIQINNNYNLNVITDQSSNELISINMTYIVTDNSSSYQKAKMLNVVKIILKSLLINQNIDINTNMNQLITNINSNNIPNIQVSNINISLNGTMIANNRGAYMFSFNKAN